MEEAIGVSILKARGSLKLRLECLRDILALYEHYGQGDRREANLCRRLIVLLERRLDA